MFRYVIGYHKINSTKDVLNSLKGLNFLNREIENNEVEQFVLHFE